jgi:hypothetical protein
MPEDDTETTTIMLTDRQQSNLQEAQTALLKSQQQSNEEQQTLNLIMSTIVDSADAQGEVEQLLLDQHMLIVGGEEVRLTEMQVEKLQSHQSIIQELKPIQQKRQERFEDLVDLYLDLEDISADPEDIQIFEDRIEVVENADAGE